MIAMETDKIHIKNLEVFGRHGVFPEENRLGQKFVCIYERGGVKG